MQTNLPQIIKHPTDVMNKTLHSILSDGLKMMLDEEKYEACAGLQSAIEDLEIKELLKK
jgi:uncharacterized protein YaaW (UPF0174 family)